MKTDELDRILSSDEILKPSSDFESKVMSRIQAETTSLPIPFPWVRFASSALILAFLAGLTSRSDAAIRANHLLWNQAGIWTIALSDPALQTASLMAVSSIVGTFLLVWGSFRLTGARD